MNYEFSKEILLKDNQEIVLLEKPIVKELTELVLNGVELYDGDFEVIDPKTIKLNLDTYDGDLLKIKCQKIKVNYTIIGDHNAVIKRYDNSKETLKKNSFYDVKVMVGGKEFSFGFTSKFDKYFNHKKIIKDDCLMLDDYLDNGQIDNRIYQNSKEIAFKTRNLEGYEDLNSPPYEVQQWVRFKTDIDLINSVYLKISSEYGSAQKNFGTTDIRKEVKLPELKLMLQEYKSKLTEYENLVFSNSAVGITFGTSRFRKSSNTDTYDMINERNTF